MVSPIKRPRHKTKEPDVPGVVGHEYFYCQQNETKQKQKAKQQQKVKL